jgi:hypothetical protein
MCLETLGIYRDVGRQNKSLRDKRRLSCIQRKAEENNLLYTIGIGTEMDLQSAQRFGYVDFLV